MLDTCGNNIDEAIKRLNNLQLSINGTGRQGGSREATPPFPSPPLSPPPEAGDSFRQGGCTCTGTNERKFFCSKQSCHCYSSSETNARGGRRSDPMSSSVRIVKEGGQQRQYSVIYGSVCLVQLPAPKRVDTSCSSCTLHKRGKWNSKLNAYVCDGGLGTLKI